MVILGVIRNDSPTSSSLTVDGNNPLWRALEKVAIIENHEPGVRRYEISADTEAILEFLREMKMLDKTDKPE